MTISDYRTRIENAAIATAAVAFTYGLNEELNQSGVQFPHFRAYPEQWLVGRADKLTMPKQQFYIYGNTNDDRVESWDALIAIWEDFKTQLATGDGKVEIVSPVETIELFFTGQTVENKYCVRIVADVKIYC